MASSPVAEFLQTLRGQAGGALLALGVQQIIVPVFPPNTAVTIFTSPAPMYVATVGVRTTANVVPNAFQLEFLQSGFRPLQGTVTADLIALGADYFFISTEGEILTIRLVNQTALNQRWESNSYFLGIVDQVALDTVNEALLRVGMPVKALSLLQDILETKRSA